MDVDVGQLRGDDERERRGAQIGFDTERIYGALGV